MTGRTLSRLAATLFWGALLAVPLRADVVEITLIGEVEQNQVAPSPLGDANVGDPVTLTFEVDSTVFVDSPNFPTRGYVIDESSFAVTLGSATLGLQSPFPAGQTPYFVLRNDDPAVDGFFTATSVDFPIGVPLDQVGALGNFINNFSVTYVGTTLTSLDIDDAVGTYDFTGLTVFNWTVDDGPFNPVLILFETLTIAEQGPWTDLGGGSPGIQGVPELSGDGPLTGGSTMTLTLANGPLSNFILLWIADSPTPFAALGGTVHAFPFLDQVILVTDPGGGLVGSTTWPPGVPAGFEIFFQFICLDGTSPFGLSLSNGLRGTTP